MKTKKWLLIIGLGLIGMFNFAYADGGNPIQKCVPTPTPHSAPPPNPPIPNAPILQNLP